MKFKIKIISAIFLAVLCFSFCACSEKKPDNSKITIIATLFPQYDFTKQIVGDNAEVALLLPPGIESHSYQPSSSDIIKISDCDLFIYTGNTMEKWAKTIIDGSDIKAPVLNLSEKLGFENTSEADDNGHNHSFDPHIWTSPKNAVSIVEQILKAVCEIDPENSEIYKNNAAEYIEKLEKLSAEIQDAVNAAQTKKIFFGGKNAFHYFLEEYGLEAASPYASCSDHAEPNASDIAAIIKEMKEKNVKAIYYPELSETATVNMLADETGATPLLLHSCHNLSKEDFENRKTYLSIMYENLKNLKAGLN